jgi:hypothetical protein
MRRLRELRAAIAAYERAEVVFPDPGRLETLRAEEQRVVSLLEGLGVDPGK